MNGQANGSMSEETAVLQRSSGTSVNMKEGMHIASHLLRASSSARDAAKTPVPKSRFWLSEHGVLSPSCMK